MSRESKGSLPRQTKPIPLTVRWNYSRRCFSSDLPSWREFFRWETFESSFEHHLASRDNWVLPALQELEKTPVSSLKLDLAASMKTLFLFDLTVGFANRRVHHAVLCVARNHQEHAAAFRSGWNSLNRLYRRVPSLCARPLRSGKIYLPDRHKRAAFGRDLPAFLAWLPESDGAPLVPLTVSQLGIRNKTGKPPTLLTARETVALQNRLCSFFLQAYDPDRREGPVMDLDKYWEWMAWRAKGTGEAGICLVFTSARWVRCTPERYLIRLLAAAWPTPSGPLPLVPEDPVVAWECIRQSDFLERVPSFGSPSFLPVRPPEGFRRGEWDLVTRKYHLLMETGGQS